MAQSVSNDALWVKLSEVEQKLDRFLVEQKIQVPTQELTGNKPDFTGVKEEIVTKIKDEIVRLERSSDLHFEVSKKNVEAIIEDILKVLNVVSRIRKQQIEAVESPKEKEAYFNFWLFKVRKTSLVIAILGILVFILTLFCMKQQNDYSLLIEEYYRQSVEVRKTQAEVDSLRNIVNTDVKYRK